MKIIKRIFITILTLLLVLVFLFNAYTFYSVKVLGKDLATINGYAVLEVVSGSMEPTIHIGDMIIINTKETNFKENDIVTFYDVNGSFVTHRILSIEGEEMVTKGDYNNTVDEAMPLSNIVGKFVFRLNGTGKLIAAFKKPFVMVMVLVIGIMVCFLISTDKDGKPILSEEEKEFREFQKKKLNSSKDEKVINKKDTSVKEKEKKKDTVLEKGKTEEPKEKTTKNKSSVNKKESPDAKTTRTVNKKTSENTKEKNKTVPEKNKNKMTNKKKKKKKK